MQQVAEWLKKFGMRNMLNRLRITIPIFPSFRDPTDQHLKDLGVSYGHRLKTPRAIRELDEASVVATALSVRPATEPIWQDGAGAF